MSLLEILLLLIVGMMVRGGTSQKEIYTLGQLTLEVTGTHVSVSVYNEKGMRSLAGELGRSLAHLNIQPVQPDNCPQQELCLSWPGLADLSVKESGLCYEVAWHTSILNHLEDCIDIGSALWYGGPEELIQHCPMRLDIQRASVPYLPGDMLQDSKKYFGGVAEPYWLNSVGGAVWVPKEQPLFYSWNDQGSERMCLAVKHQAPYPTTNQLTLSYSLCAADNARRMQEYAALQLWRRPSGLPDTLMLTHPVWSTWAQYKADINASVVLQLGQDIVANGFRASQLEIDDNWEACYGQAGFDRVRFPDPAGMVADLKALGLRVTLWVHPFVNAECEAIYSEAVSPPRMYLVRDPSGKFVSAGGPFGEWEGVAHLPGLVWWWQGLMAGCVDFTNPEAVAWWSERLEKLRNEIGIDSFKFDAGESNWLPSAYILNQAEARDSWPGIFSTRYVESLAQFGGQVEVRTGRHTQHVPVFVRMLDKSSTWGYDNGLKSMVTSLLQFGLVGYPFVLPDMIGGNGYEDSDDPLHNSNPPSRELYIRWLQANVFMPAMQISFLPWIYDEEVVQHAREMTELHASYAPKIIELAAQAVETGLLINRPIWWLDPEDEEALRVDSEFLLGDDILVAPVLEEGMVSRDIYLPAGRWEDGNTGMVLTGPGWYYDQPANLFTLPYFIRLA